MNVNMSWVALDRICQEKADAEEADRLREVCENTDRPDEAREFGEQAERLRQKPLRPAVGEALAPPPGPTARRVKVERKDPCPCGSGKKFKKCCL